MQGFPRVPCSDPTVSAPAGVRGGQEEGLKAPDGAFNTEVSIVSRPFDQLGANGDLSDDVPLVARTKRWCEAVARTAWHKNSASSWGAVASEC